MTLTSTVYPGWSSHGGYDYVLFQLSTDGTTANAAFGFGGATQSGSYTMAYLEAESAVLVPYNDYVG